MPYGFYKLYIRAIDLIEISYFYLKFGDFLSECFNNLRRFHENENSSKTTYIPIPHVNFQVNNILDIYEHLENNFLALHFYLVKILELLLITSLF